MKIFHALSLSDAVFILVINVNWHFKIYEQDKFCAQLSLITSEPDQLASEMAI